MIDTARGVARGHAKWWLKKEQRQRAIDMSSTFFGTGRSRSRRLARAQVVEHEVRRIRNETRFDPTRTTIAGIEHADRASTRTHGGIVFVSVHCGQTSWAGFALGANGYRNVVPLGDWATLRTTEMVRRLEHRLAELDRCGCTPLFTTEGNTFSKLSAHVEDGRHVFMPVDVRGSRATPFLGLHLSMASGATALAWSTGAPVVPAIHVQRGHRSTVELEPAIWPDEFEREDEFRARVMGEMSAVLSARAASADVQTLAGWFGAELGHPEWVPRPVEDAT